MPAGGIDVNEYHYGSAISACEKSGKWEAAVGLLQDMKGRRQDKAPAGSDRAPPWAVHDRSLGPYNAHEGLIDFLRYQALGLIRTLRAL